MKVYIVINHSQFYYSVDDKDIVGVFNTNEAAEAFVAARYQRYGRNWDEVEEYEVQQ
jgi:hypothetical protein